MNYEQYLKTDAWKQKARERLKIDDYRCQMCGAQGNQLNPLEVHHMTYHNLGHENTYKDLVTLCHCCHQGVHRMMNRTTGIRQDGKYIRGWKDELRLTQHVVKVGFEKEYVDPILRDQFEV